MLDNPIHLEVEQPCDKIAIEQMHARIFGPGRFARTAYRLRENSPSARDLCFVARVGSKLVGSTQLTPIWVGATALLLLGPLTVEPAFRCRGIGMALLQISLAAATQKGYGVVVLVGDAAYYERAGFRHVPAGRLELPGPVDPQRFLYKELVPGALEGVSGVVKPL